MREEPRRVREGRAEGHGHGPARGRQHVHGTQQRGLIPEAEPGARANRSTLRCGYVFNQALMFYRAHLDTALRFVVIIRQTAQARSLVPGHAVR